MKPLSVKLPETLAQWLAGEAKLRRRSRSAIVREALEEQRDGRAKEKKPASMADALHDLKGTLRGPRDLSTNPRHLEGFGR